MDLIGRVGDREVRLSVRRTGSGFEIEVDGRTRVVHAVGTTAGRQSLIVEGAQHEVGIYARGGGSYWISTRTGGFEAQILDPLSHLAAAAGVGTAASGERRVDAYMPGRVVAVLVTEGESLVEGQGVVVLEAMKMENEIRAGRDGVVSRIFVEPGQAVEVGDPLFALD